MNNLPRIFIPDGRNPALWHALRHKACLAVRRLSKCCQDRQQPVKLLARAEDGFLTESARALNITPADALQAADRQRLTWRLAPGPALRCQVAMDGGDWQDLTL